MTKKTVGNLPFVAFDSFFLYAYEGKSGIKFV